MNKNRTRWVVYVVLAMICLGALGLRTRGLNWPFYHPDERTIARWVVGVSETGQLRESVYAGGSLVLLNRLYSIWLGVRNHLQVESLSFQPGMEHDILFIRGANALIASLTCLLVFLLCCRISGSRRAGLLGAAFLALSQIDVEHSHYAESDTLMLAMLCLAFWLWARYADGRRRRDFVLACLAGGFAIGTKFTLTPLLLVPIWYSVAPAGPDELGWERLKKGLGRMGLALLLLVAGLTVANWIYLRDPGFFFAGLEHGRQRVYHETRGILGAAYGDVWAERAGKLRHLTNYALSAGLPWLLLAAAGVVVLLWRSKTRRYAGLLFGFGLFYLYYFLIASPWVRSQEFMPLLPVLAVLGSLCLDRLFERAGRRPAALTGAVLVLLIAFYPAMRNSLRMASIFGSPDPRRQAEDWLERHAAFDRTMGFEVYTWPVFTLFDRAVDLYKVERSGLEAVYEGGCDYVLRNVKHFGRGILHPRTGLPFPDYQSRADAFHVQTTRLAAWGPVKPDPVEATFCGAGIELYGVGAPDRPPPAGRLLARPARVEHGGPPVYSGGRLPLGSHTAVMVDRRGSRLLVGDTRGTEGVFLVLTTAERSAHVRVKGFGRRVAVDLPAFGAKVMEMKRPAYLPRLATYETIRLKAVTRPHLVYLPCYARVVFYHDDVVRLLMEARRYEQARAHAVRHSDAVHPALAYLAAVAAGDAGGSEALAPAALQTAASLREALAAPEPGDPLGAWYDDFSRVRFWTGKGRSIATRIPTDDDRMEGLLRTDLRLPPGRYTLEFFLVHPPALSFSLVLEDQWGRPLPMDETRTLALTPDRSRTRVRSRLHVRHETEPVVRIITPHPSDLLLADGTLSWSYADRVGEWLDRFETARGEPDDGLRIPPASLTWCGMAALTGVDLLAGGEGLRCRMTLLMEDAPPLALRLVRRRRHRMSSKESWREVTRIPLQNGQRIPAGKPLVFHLPLPDEARTAAGASDLAVEVVADVRWSPGIVRLDEPEGLLRMGLEDVLKHWAVPPEPQP